MSQVNAKEYAETLINENVDDDGNMLETSEFKSMSELAAHIRSGLVFMHKMPEAKARMAVSKILKDKQLGGTRGKINNKVLVTAIRENMQAATGTTAQKEKLAKDIAPNVGGTYKTIMGIFGAIDFAKEYALQELQARDIATLGEKKNVPVTTTKRARSSK